MKATIIHDEKLKGYIVEVEHDGYTIPVGRIINRELNLWEIVVWDTYDDAKQWIRSSKGKIQLK